MKNSIAKITVILKMNIGTSVPKFIAKVQNIHAMLLDNQNFPDAQTLLAQFLADVNALVSAETLVATRVKGSAATRDAQKLTVFNQADVLRGIVQSVVNIPAYVNKAVGMAQSAGMDIKGHSSRVKGELEAKHGKVSGSVILIAHAAGTRAAYKWQQSTDGVTWINCDPDTTTEAKNEVEGLTPGINYYFHFQPVLPLKAKNNSSSKAAARGPGNWSQPQKIMMV